MNLFCYLSNISSQTNISSQQLLQSSIVLHNLFVFSAMIMIPMNLWIRTQHVCWGRYKAQTQSSMREIKFSIDTKYKSNCIVMDYQIFDLKSECFNDLFTVQRWKGEIKIYSYVHPSIHSSIPHHNHLFPILTLKVVF